MQVFFDIFSENFKNCDSVCFDHLSLAIPDGVLYNELTKHSLEGTYENTVFEQCCKIREAVQRIVSILDAHAVSAGLVDRPAGKFSHRQPCASAQYACPENRNKKTVVQAIHSANLRFRTACGRDGLGVYASYDDRVRTRQNGG